MKLFKKKRREDEPLFTDDELNLTFGHIPGSDTETDYKSGEFINSVEDLTEDDIELSSAAKKFRAEPSDIPQKFFYFVFLAVFIASCAYLVYSTIEKYRASAIYDSLQQEFYSTGFDMDFSYSALDEDGEVAHLTSDTEINTMHTVTESIEQHDEETEIDIDESLTETKTYNEELQKMRKSLEALSAVNPDTYGWIYIEGTNINYPLVQGDDNSYYLNHAYNGDYLPVGSLFVDWRDNESITKNYNTIIYGHNITTGTMMHDLVQFFKDSYFYNTYIYIYTMDGVFIYEPFAVYETRYDYNYFRTSFKNGDEFLEFANEVAANSAKTKDVTFTKNDRILTLSTCTNGAYYGRYALHAKLVKTITD